MSDGVAINKIYRNHGEQLYYKVSDNSQFVFSALLTVESCSQVVKD